MTPNKGTQHQSDVEKAEEKLKKDNVASTTGAAVGLMGQQMWMEQAAEEPDQARPEDVLTLQTHYGNQTIRRVIDPSSDVQYSASDHGELDRYISEEIKRARGGGQPLQPDVRGEKNEQFGHDFKSVRIHTDSQADRLSRQIQAKAFTVGNSIFFRQNAYNPGTSQGRGTLNHELTHVMQQSGGSHGSGALTLGKADDQYEQQADRMANMQSAPVQSGWALQRDIVQRDGFFSDLGGAISGVFKKKPPTEVPQGMDEELWRKLEKKGITEAIWAALSNEKKDVFKSEDVLGNSKLFKWLLKNEKDNQWPKGDDDETYDAAVLLGIKKTTIPIEAWNPINETYKGYLLGLVGSLKSSLLIKLSKAAEADNWPMDGGGGEITNATQIKNIRKTGIGFREWNGKDAIYRGYLLALGGDMKAAKLKELAGVAEATKWPRREATPKPTQQDPLATEEKEITDAPTLLVLSKTGISYADWNDINEKYRGYLLALSGAGALSKSHLRELALTAKDDKWPLDGSDADITDEAVLTKIRKVIALRYEKWCEIGVPEQREALLDLTLAQKMRRELGKAAVAGKWPVDDTGADILDEDTLKQIRNDLKVSFLAWANAAIFVNDRKKSLLALVTPEKEYAHELAWSAIKSNWPKDGTSGGADIKNAAIAGWVKNKKADISKILSPAEWNGFAHGNRNTILGKADLKERYQEIIEARKVVNDPEYARQEGGAASKILGFTGKKGVTGTTGILGAISGFLGMSGGIASAVKGPAAQTPGYSPEMDITSGSLGAAADVIDTGTSGFSLFESITSMVRGGQRRKKHASRASKKVGKKEQTKGAWGALGSGFGLLGSLSNLGGNISKIVGGGQEKAKKDSGQAAGAASGVLGLLGGAMGAISGGIGLVEGVKSAIRGGIRRIQASSKDYTKPGSTDANDVKLRNIANFTAKNQKIWGSIMSSVNSTLAIGGGISGVVGGIAQLAGDNTTGFVADIVGASASGLGMAGGLAQTAIEHKDDPKDQDLMDRANDLIELLELGDPNGKNAAKFALKVLKINFIDLTNDVTWTDWIKEDENSAKDLIKSKMSKH